MTDHPIGADVIVIGGGTAGAIVAAWHISAPGHHLPGVGAHLQDQPVVTIEFAASDALLRALANHKQTLGFVPEEQTVAKIASRNLPDALRPSPIPMDRTGRR